MKKLAFTVFVITLIFLVFIWTSRFGLNLPSEGEVPLLNRDAWFLAAIGLVATSISLVSLFVEFKVASPLTFIGWVLYLPVILNVLVPMFIMFFSIIGLFYTPWLIFTDIPYFYLAMNGVIRLPYETLASVVQYCGYSLIASGLAIYAIGLFQILRSAAYKTDLVTTGLYSIVRHPQYLGIFLWTLGYAISGWRLINYLMWLTLCYSYMLLAEHEETKLVDRFGERYTDYAGKVSLIFPHASILTRLFSRSWEKRITRTLVYTFLYIILLFAFYYLIAPYIVVTR